jgi:hypothetical protein
MDYDVGVSLGKGVAVQVEDSMYNSSNESCTVYGNRCGNDKRLDDPLLCTLLTSWSKGSLCLQHLTLRSHSISDSGFEAICTYIYGFNDPILRTLDLEGNDITGNCISKLDLGSSRCSIELLNLSSNPLGILGGQVIADALTSNVNLHHLYLNNCEFPLNTLILLATSMVSLQLEYSPTIQRVCPLVTLELDRPLLWCESNKQEEGSEHLSRLMMLASKSPLSSLSLRYFNMQNFGAQILAESMYRSYGSIMSLNLEGNAIGVAGAEAIATFIILQSQESIKFGKCLKVLKLANNKISNEGAAAMAQALITNTTLEELTLTNNGISHGLVAIGKALEKNNTLGRLTLFGNDFDMESGKIFNGLQNNRFTYLNISIDIQVYIIDGNYMVAEKST